jgi:hypothetical protein
VRIDPGIISFYEGKDEEARSDHKDHSGREVLVLLREANLAGVAEHGGLRAQIHFTDVR